MTILFPQESSGKITSTHMQNGLDDPNGEIGIIVCVTYSDSDDPDAKVFCEARFLNVWNSKGQIGPMTNRLVEAAWRRHVA